VEGFVRRKKKGIARKAAKTQRQSAAAESHIERTTISLRLCAFARVKNKKSIWLPAILRGRLQSRQDAKAVRRGGKSNRADHNSFAPLRLSEKKKESAAAD